MTRKAKLLLRLLVCLCISGSSTLAAAGDVKLVSDTLDIVCRVEVSWGAGAPEGTPVEQHLDVHRGWSVSKPGRLCYRRASTPDNCDSGMTQWNTRWRCADAADTGIEQLSLQ